MEWGHFRNEGDVPSPALVLHLERIDENLRRMLRIIGDPARLRPHIKTHKLPQILNRQLALGVTKCKAATIAEAEMAALAGVPDILLAAQPVGPNISRFIQLNQKFPDLRFSTLCDSPASVQALQNAAQASCLTLELFLDVDVGQHRSGVLPGPTALELAHQIHSSHHLSFSGLHCYDGHIHQGDVLERSLACEAAFEPVWKLRDALLSSGLPVATIIAGGTPTFPIHAQHSSVECSPGTCVLWDAGYASKLPDCDFLPAATLLTRVISHPGQNRICLDLGHKAVASEMPHPRMIFPSLPDAQCVIHSEEHLVLELKQSTSLSLGTVLHAIPWHICPTVALHSEVYVLSGESATERWPVTARTRRISI